MSAQETVNINTESPSKARESLNRMLANSITALENTCSPQELAHKLSRGEYKDLVKDLDTIHKLALEASRVALVVGMLEGFNKAVIDTLSSQPKGQ